jgi:flagellar protein FliT
LSTVQELLDLNRTFYYEINRPVPKNERDQMLSIIKLFLEKRDGLINNLKGPHSSEDKQIGEQIMEYDYKIQTIFSTIKQEIQQDLSLTKKQKKSTPKFINPYKSTLVNGVFLDKRK